MISPYEAGSAAEIAREDAILMANGIKTDGTVPERVAPISDDTDLISSGDVRTVRGFSLTMSGPEFPLDPAVTDRLKRIAADSRSTDGPILH